MEKERKKMSRFIKVHREGIPHLINLDWVEEIHENTIYFAFNVPNAVEQDYLEVDETFEQLLKMIVYA
jgi:hypothetical protein